MRSDSGSLRELGEAPLGRLVFRFSWPALVSMTLNALYAVVDRIYIGNGADFAAFVSRCVSVPMDNGCGLDAMAALSLAIPILVACAAFGVWIGAGHSSLLSIRLGEGDSVAAEKTLGQLVAFKLLFFLTLPFALMPFLDPLLRAIGGVNVSPAAMCLARRYLELVLPFQVFSHLAFGLSAMMRSEGAVLKSMACMVVGFGTNLVLDPILIIGFGLGVEGAAWATNVAMAASCAMALRHYLRGQGVVPLRMAFVRFHRGLAARAMGIGAGPFLQQALGAMIGLSLTKSLSMWAASSDEGTVQLAALGIFQSVQILFFTPVMGVQQGIGPIVGYNWGARNYARVRRGVFLGFWTTTVLVSTASILQLLCPDVIAAAFGARGECLTVSARVLRIAGCMLWSIGVNVVATTYFQSIGKPLTAIALSTMRQGLCLLPCLWILPHAMRDHVLGIWLALPISDAICQIATVPPLWMHLRFLKRAGAIRDSRRGRAAAAA